MTAMGNRFGIHCLETESVHSIQDVSEARIPDVIRPNEVPVLTKEVKETTRSEFGSSCHDPEDQQTKAVYTEFAQRYSGPQTRGRESESFLCSPEDSE